MSYLKFAKDLGITGITNALVALSGLVTLPILTKVLGASDYGIWIQMQVTLSLLPTLANLGLPYTLVRFLPGEQSKEIVRDGYYSVFTIVFVVSLIISIIMFLCADSVAGLLGCSEKLIWILSVILPIECLIGVCIAVLRAFQKINLYAFFIIIKTYGEVALIAFLLLVRKQGLVEVLMVSLGIKVVIFIALFILIGFKINICIPRFKQIKEYLRFGLPTVPGNISSWVTNASDRYVIGYFFGAAYVGYYSPGYSLGGIIGMFAAPIGFIMPAVLSELYDTGEINQVKIYMKYTFKYFMLIAIPAVFGLSLLSKDLLIVLSTPDIARNGYLVTPFISLGSLLLGVTIIVSQVLVLTKKTYISGTSWILAALINLILNIIFVPRFGIVAAAASTMLSYVFSLVFMSYYSLKYMRLDVDWLSIGKCILAAIVMGVIICIFQGNVSLKVVIGVAVYSLVAYLLKVVSPKEFELLKEMVLIKAS